MITITENKSLISATIELTDISRKDYEDICAFIKAKLRKIQKDCETDELEEGKASKLLDALYNSISDLYIDCESNPKDYILAVQTTWEFIETHPEFEGIDPRPIGRTLSRIVRERASKGIRYEVIRKQVYSKNIAKRVSQNAFTVPVKCETFGRKLRTCRIMSKLSIKELADAIGYPIDVVKKWEDDIYAPAPEAVKTLSTVLGSDILPDISSAPKGE